ncbi:hypothetical protein BDY19DRAFT_963183, partial [Irpex rosettiformis]
MERGYTETSYTRVGFVVQQESSTMLISYVFAPQALGYYLTVAARYSLPGRTGSATKLCTVADR